jgi:hypothetical protein
MATQAGRKSDPLEAPAGGWPLRPIGTPAELRFAAKWLWSIPPRGANCHAEDNIRSFERQIYGLSCALLHDLNNREMLTTKRQHLDLLNEIVTLACKLRQRLEVVDGENGPLRLFALQSIFYRYAPDFRYPMPNMINLEEFLRFPLDVLIEIAAAQIEDIQTVAPGAGHQRLHDRLFGDPRFALAVRCAALMAELYRPPAVKSTIGGAVHQLMNRIWTLATGLDPEEFNLSAFMKKGIRDWREGEFREPSSLYRTALNRAKKRRLKT